MGTLGILTIIAGLLGGLVIAGWQTMFFLREGLWPTYKATDLLFWLTEEKWFVYPDSWKGVHVVLDWLPAGVFVYAAGFIIGIVLIVSADKRPAS